VLNLGFKTVLNLLLVPLLGYAGFAYATSAMYLLTGLIMLHLLARRLGGLRFEETFRGLRAPIAGAALVIIVAVTASRMLATEPPMVRLLLGGGSAGIVYLGALWTVSEARRPFEGAVGRPVEAEIRKVL
jgi:peptidoglycan biosynthesis protein MviN/MurJ (putative lipid II flippase)